MCTNWQKTRNKMFLYFVFNLFAGDDFFSTPFENLILNKTKKNEISQKYRITGFQKNQNFPEGVEYELDIKAFTFPGLRKAFILCDSKEVVQRVLFIIDKKYFDDYYCQLKKKYEFNEKLSSLPYVGDQSAHFVAGDFLILLNAPHLSFTMTLEYVSGFVYSKMVAEFALRIANQAPQV